MSFYTRKPTRIPGYDYSSRNYYFITICTSGKKCIFGTPGNLNSLGCIADSCMKQIESIFPGVKVDNYVIMPNHVHAIIVIGTEEQREQIPNVSTVVGQYKAAVTRKIRNSYPTINVWQRSFHDHIIRNQQGYEKIWEYVQYNPQKWKDDCFYVES